MAEGMLLERLCAGAARVPVGEEVVVACVQNALDDLDRFAREVASHGWS